LLHLSLTKSSSLTLILLTPDFPQPRLIRKREMKLVFLGGEFSHICEPYSKIGGPNFAEDEELINFAKLAVDKLRERGRGEVWLDGLFRVDIMYDGVRMVVNEIESLEAEYSNSEVDNGRVLGFMLKYWFKQLVSAVYS